MTEHQIRALATRYEECILHLFREAKPVHYSKHIIPLVAQAEHLLWMIQEIRSLSSTQVARAARWLGFVEGSLYQLGFMTIAEIQRQDVDSFFQTITV